MVDQTTPTVGKLLTGIEGRDAIHFALAPVVAGESMLPGDWIGFVEDDCHMPVVRRSHPIALGIVDPFLGTTVKAGDRFWMFLKPNTITNLRHLWSHPAFPPAKVPGSKEAVLQHFAKFKEEEFGGEG